MMIIINTIINVTIMIRYYGGVGIAVSREEELRRERAREREERDKMVRDYIRFAFHEDNGRDDDKEEEEDDNHRHIDHDDATRRSLIRNGRGWSQPEVARRREEMEDRRKLPR